MIGAIASHFVAGAPVADLETEMLADAPILYLSGQETSGTTAIDSSGNGLDGTYVGGITLDDAADPVAPAGVGKHVRLDGSSGYLTLPDGGTWFTPDANGFSFEGWYYVRSVADWARIFEFTNSGEDTAYYFQPHTTDTGDDMRLAVAGGMNQDAGNWLPTGVWIHLVVTVNNAGGFVVYVDNAVYASGTTGNPTDGPRATMVIGVARSLAFFTPMSFARQAVYNSVLAAERVDAHYRAGITPPPPYPSASLYPAVDLYPGGSAA